MAARRLGGFLYHVGYDVVHDDTLHHIAGSNTQHHKDVADSVLVQETEEEGGGRCYFRLPDTADRTKYYPSVDWSELRVRIF